VKFWVEMERETDGRWIAEVSELPGVLAYGSSEAEAQAKVQALAPSTPRDQLAEHSCTASAGRPAAHRVDGEAAVWFPPCSVSCWGLPTTCSRFTTGRDGNAAGSPLNSVFGGQ
jgi:hypothetical protein